MKICYVDITGGLGNAIQSVPFIKACHNHFDEVYGVYTANGISTKLYVDMLPLFENLFTDKFIYPSYPGDGIRFTAPTESPWRDTFTVWDVPEHEKWFKIHGIPQPDTYDTSMEWESDLTEEYDVIMWAGCKPNWKSKMWPYWSDLSNLFFYCSKRIAIIGYPEEGGIMPDHVIDYRGKLDLQDTLQLISNAGMFIGNEGGIGHLAASTNTPTYILWGSTDPIKNSFPSKKTTYRIALNLPCQPCQTTEDRGFDNIVGCHDIACLKYLTPDIVKSYISKSQESYSKI